MRAAVWLTIVTMLAGGCDSSSDRDRQPAADSSTTSSSSTFQTAPVPTTSGGPPKVTVAASGVAGWWDGRGWVTADGKQPVPVSGGETYSVLSLTGPAAKGVGSDDRKACETDPGTSDITIPGLDVQDGAVRPGPIAVSNVATPRPRETAVLDPAGSVYREEAGKFLAERGIDDPDADVVQALRADLEGDAKDEVILIAERIADRAGLYARLGDYSFVLLRRVVGDAVRTTLVAESVPNAADGGTPFIYSHRVSAIADLNGDGRMELALDVRQYEGTGVSVHELQPDGAMPTVMASECGA
jgi:hypothetical protein